MGGNRWRGSVRCRDEGVSADNTSPGRAWGQGSRTIESRPEGKPTAIRLLEVATPKDGHKTRRATADLNRASSPSVEWRINAHALEPDRATLPPFIAQGVIAYTDRPCV